MYTCQKAWFSAPPPGQTIPRMMGGCIGVYAAKHSGSAMFSCGRLLRSYLPHTGLAAASTLHEEEKVSA